MVKRQVLNQSQMWCTWCSQHRFNYYSPVFVDLKYENQSPERFDILFHKSPFSGVWSHLYLRTNGTVRKEIYFMYILLQFAFISLNSRESKLRFAKQQFCDLFYTDQIMTVVWFAFELKISYGNIIRNWNSGNMECSISQRNTCKEVSLIRVSCSLNRRMCSSTFRYFNFCISFDFLF